MANPDVQASNARKAARSRKKQSKRVVRPNPDQQAPVNRSNNTPLARGQYGKGPLAPGAAQPRPKPKQDRKRPLGVTPLGSKPFTRQREEQRRKTERARDATGQRTRPQTKGLKSKDPKVRVKAFRDLTRPYLEESIRLQAELRERGSDRSAPSPKALLLQDSNKTERERIRSFLRTSKFVDRASDADRAQRSEARPFDARDVKVAGVLPVEAAAEKVFSGAEGQSAKRLITGVKDLAEIGVKTPYYLGEATIEDPKAVAKSSLRTAKESVAGIPQAVKMLATDPGEAVKQIGEDYKRRYGPILTNPEKFKKQVKSESGLTPFLFDAATAGAGAGRVAALGAASRPAQAALKVSAAKPGKAGAPARTVLQATAGDRPNIRFSGGSAGVQAQRGSGNLFKGVSQQVIDSKRTAKYERSIKNKGWREGPDGKLEAVGPRVAEVDAVRPLKGEVLPYYSPREWAGVRKYAGRQQRAIGRAKSRTRLQLLTHRGRTLEEVDKSLKKLSKEEAVALHASMSLGLPSLGENPKALAAALVARRDQIIEARGDGDYPAAQLAETNDNLKTIERMLEDPAKYFTPKLREVTDDLLKIQKREEAQDPGLHTATAIAGRLNAQADFLGVKRAGNEARYIAALTGLDVDVAKAAGSRGKPVPGVSHVEVGRSIAEVDPPKRKAAAKVLADEAKKDRDALERKWTRQDKHVAVLRAQARDRPTDFRKEKLENAERELGDLTVARDAARDTHRAAIRIHSRTAKNPDFPRDYEDITTFEKRVAEAAEAAGLKEPGYWASMPRDEGYSLATAGGSRLTHIPKQRQGVLFEKGVESDSPDVFRRGLERSMKRRFTWNLVGKNIEAHAFDWSRAGGSGISRKEAVKYMRDHGIDPDSVELIDTGGAWKQRADLEDVNEGFKGDPDDFDDFASMIPQMDDAARAALRRDVKSPVDPDEIKREQRGAGEFEKTGLRFYVVPKDTTELLRGAVTRDSQVSRAVEIVVKQKPARIMLGLANTGWLSFQILSNGLLTGIGTKGAAFGDIANPRFWKDMHTFWKNMDPDQKEVLEVELGVGHMHKYEQRHLGEVKGDGLTSHLVNGTRAFKASGLGEAMHKVNPLDAMFRIDEAQNNFFRRLMFTSKARRDAYDKLGKSYRVMYHKQADVAKEMDGKSVPEIMEAMLSNPAKFEKNAKAVNDFLGNYVDYSPAERKLLSRNVMFYGYLRFSLRFIFYTMPVEHPVMANVAANLGRLGADEIKRLTGVGDQLPKELQEAYRRRTPIPMNVMANVWLGDHASVTAGTSGVLPIGRANPALNSLVSMEKWTQMVGLVSPLYQMGVNQAFEESTFTGKTWRINPKQGVPVGVTTPDESRRPAGYFGSPLTLLNPSAYAEAFTKEGGGAQRNRILLKELLTLTAPGRYAQSDYQGSQADTSLPWDRVPMAYGNKDTREKIEKAAKAAEGVEKKGLGNEALRFFLPAAAPKANPYPSIRKRELEKDEESRATKARIIDGKLKPKKRRRKSTKKSSGFGGFTKPSSGGMWGG